jgi:hemerythrin-like domain-containing protein
VDAGKALRRDHRIVLTHVTELEAAVESLEDGNRRRDRTRFQRASEWFLSHLVRELETRSEGLYGRAIETGGSAAEAATQLRVEHDETHGLIEALRGAVEADADVDDVRRAARSLCAHLREHCWKEEHLLLPCLPSVS